MNSENAKIVMLYSGGADSLLMLKFALMSGKIPHCVLINYGQKNVEELEFAKKQLDDVKISWQVVTIKDLNVDSGLTGELKEARWDNVHEMHVPARNTIFISIAMSIAENMNLDEVWYGPDYSDRTNLFPDCYQEYVVKMNEIMEIAGPKPITLVAPLLGMTKEIILDILKHQFGIQEKDMYSGYDHPGCTCKGDDACSDCGNLP